MRAAIIGLYNSGSSILSNIVQELGVNIGAPLWGNHFESRSLRSQLVDWWSEPQLVERVAREDRLPFLKWWVEHQESKNGNVCAKHPLLCLSAEDLDLAWGDGVKIIRANRQLEKSINGLAKRKWFKDPEGMQRRLYDASERYFRTRNHLSINYDELLDAPLHNVRQIVSFLGIEAPDEQIYRAAELVRRSEPHSITFQ